MSLQILINTPCTIVKRQPDGTVDEYGNDVPVETLVETHCEIQQRQSLEPVGQGELGITTWDVFFQADEDFGQGDALIVHDEIYEAIGPPWQVRNSRTQTASHVQATVRRTAGVGVGS